MIVTWRDEPPSDAEINDLTIIGWAFRGNGSLPCIVTISHDRDVYMSGNPTNFPISMFHGKWCPIRFV